MKSNVVKFPDRGPIRTPHNKVTDIVGLNATLKGDAHATIIMLKIWSIAHAFDTHPLEKSGLKWFQLYELSGGNPMACFDEEQGIIIPDPQTYNPFKLGNPIPCTQSSLARELYYSKYQVAKAFHNLHEHGYIEHWVLTKEVQATKNIPKQFMSLYGGMPFLQVLKWPTLQE